MGTAFYEIEQAKQGFVAVEDYELVKLVNQIQCGRCSRCWSYSDVVRQVSDFETREAMFASFGMHVYLTGHFDNHRFLTSRKLKK